jgi:hypothetical protein
VPHDSIQTNFLEEVKKRMPPNRSYVDELAEILSISKDSAYRRIRGDTVLSLDEARKLCDHTGVSIDSLFSPTSKSVPFADMAAGGNITLEEWLNGILKNVSVISEMIYTARDIPIWHYLRKPELAAFKMFFWQKTVMGNPGFQNLIFEPDLIPKEMIQLGERIWEKYSAVQSTEIWGAEALHHTLKQIQFYEECGFLKHREQVSRLYDELADLMSTIQAEASEAKKTDGNSFHLYYNEVLTMDNSVIARTRETQLTFLNYNTTGLLVTRHNGFCEKMRQYQTSLITHSTLISGTAEKERIKFFSRLTNLLDRRSDLDGTPMMRRMQHDG